MVKEFACPCGSQQTYSNCCGLVHADIKAAKCPEQLMRARYCAYAKGNISFVLLSQKLAHSAPDEAEQSRAFAAQSEFISLRILNAPRAKQNSGQVEFMALIKQGQQLIQLHELSNFKRDQGVWYYSGGDAKFNELN
ncbi:YchJ family protein [Gayadomonas joobiniege]|uniref:YchJ family protein n=1 Tax=Gayadomonas joobiniege TaxID=1234606 RepID=UPI00036D9ED3|nr:YchJ family metal-binding protein [Gayadomonas joobiniege]